MEVAHLLWLVLLKSEFLIIAGAQLNVKQTEDMREILY